ALAVLLLGVDLGGLRFRRRQWLVQASGGRRRAGGDGLALTFALRLLRVGFLDVIGLRFRGRRWLAQAGGDRGRAGADGLALGFGVLAFAVRLLAVGRGALRLEHRQLDGLAFAFAVASFVLE